MKLKAIILSVCIGVLPALVSPTFAKSPQKKDQSAQKKKSQKQRKKNRGRRTPLTEKQEEAALTFAKNHHSELAELLVRLKENRKNQYQRAIRQLFTTSERLERFKKKAPERFEQQLKNWKLDSRIRLLMARNAMGGDDELLKKIRVLVEDKIDLRLLQLKSEQERAKTRLGRVEQQIEKIETNRNAAIEKEMNRLKRTLGKRKARKRKKKKKDGIEN